MAILLEEYRSAQESLRYGFAVGKVRILETRLLGRSMLERLVGASGFPEQKRILSETLYGRFLEPATSPAEVEAAIEAALDSAYVFLDEAGLPPAVGRFFRLRFDFGNLKSALKARALGVGLEGLIAPHGTVPAEAFSAPLEQLPKPLGTLATALARAGDDVGDAALMGLDAAVDREMFKALIATADEVGSDFLRFIARLLIDLANLKTLVRAQAAGISPESVEGELLLDGGSVRRRELGRICRMPRSGMLATLERRLALRGAPLSSDEDLDLDVVVDNALVAAVRKGRRAEPGAEHVIAYVLAREAEAQVLRVALLGKMAGLDSAALHRRMRASFR